jgi:hypothetical protein
MALVRRRTIPSNRRLSAKLVPTFLNRGCRVVSTTDQSRIIIDLITKQYISQYIFILTGLIPSNLHL